MDKILEISRYLFSFEMLGYLFSYGILIYSILIFSAYLILAVISLIEAKKYIKRNSYVDIKILLTSPLLPTISLVAPAFNEGLNIIENVKSLMSLHYNDYEVIIINDGSTDDTMEKLINEFHLEKVNFAYHEQIKAQQVKGCYKSTNPAFHKLTIVDKENGGKADALNVGLNMAANRLISIIDVDCVLEEDALLKMVKPFLEETDKKVIAAGGVIRIINSCDVKDGRLQKVNIPKNLIARFQVLEYIRAFILNRMAWGKLDGLLLISGAFGMFDKETVINAGGYSPKTVGEDMELVVRMRKYMRDQKIKYKVAFIPDPLCWTEVPESYKILGRQRNRWARGSIETLWMHRKMFMNPKYGILGLISFPYWMLFEWLAPIIEFLGILFFIYLILTGFAGWTFFLFLLAAVYSFALMFSIIAMFVEENTYHQYRRPLDMIKLLFVGTVELFIFHPYVMLSSVAGNIAFLFGRNRWGNMKRVGFNKEKRVEQ